MHRSLIAATASIALAFGTVAPVSAEPPVLRQVTYTITAQHPVLADIYYREVDPPTWSDYSHNPYMFSPKASVEIGPDRPWSRTVALIDPEQWAMVVASSASSERTPGESGFRCELAVDGVVVIRNDGPKGALCAMRHW